jgi:hypothetical protein
MKVFGYDISFSKAVDITKTQPMEANIRRVVTWEQQIQRIRQDIQKWRTAVKQAESVYFPNRYLLYQTYKDVVLDAHLSGAMQQRTLNAANSGWQMVNKTDGLVNEEATKLFETTWFQKFLYYAMESKFWGHSLIQLGDLEDDKFNEIELIPRHYVKPEFCIVTQHAAGTAGERYDVDPYIDWVISVGEKRDLGLLMKASPYVIWKKNTMGAWSEHAEIFGSPLRIGKTDTRDELTRSNMENMMSQMGSAPWAVVDKEDLVEIIEGGKKDVSRIYGGLVDLMNKEISKLILGQTMTMDDGSSRSQAEVHERVAKQVEQADKEFLCSTVNDILFPVLKRHGFKVDSIRFEFVEKDQLKITDQADFDIELIKSGKYHIDPEYILSKYGTPVEEIEEEQKEEENDKPTGAVNVNDFIAEQAKKFSNLYK